MLLRSRKLTFFLVSIALYCVVSVAQAPAPAHRPTSTPYTGDPSIFDSPAGSGAVANQARDGHPRNRTRQKCRRYRSRLGIFYGTGSAKSGDKGAVYPVDINPEAIQYIDARVKKEDPHNVKTILGKEDDPLLPAPVDAVLLLKTYHEVAQPIVLFRNLRKSLVKEARVGVIDRNGNGTDHGVGREVVVREMKEGGYKPGAAGRFRQRWNGLLFGIRG